MTRGRPGFVKRAFNLNPLNSQTWAIIRICTNFVNSLSACKTIGKNSYRCARFELFSEFQNGGFIPGCIKITNKIIFTGHPHHTRINAIHNRFTLALKPRCGDTKFILTSVRWIKRSQTNRLPRRRRKADYSSIILMPKDFLCGSFNRMHILKAVLFFDKRWLGKIGDCCFQPFIRTFQIFVHQKR